MPNQTAAVETVPTGVLDPRFLPHLGKQPELFFWGPAQEFKRVRHFIPTEGFVVVDMNSDASVQVGSWPRPQKLSKYFLDIFACEPETPTFVFLQDGQVLHVRDRRGALIGENGLSYVSPSGKVCWIPADHIVGFCSAEEFPRVKATGDIASQISTGEQQQPPSNPVAGTDSGD